MSTSSTSSQGRTYAGESPAERQARRRQSFVEAGLELFGSRGYRATTVRRLCRTAGLTDRYFYQCFGTMEELLVAVYERQVAEIQAAVLAAVQARQGEQDVQRIIDAGLHAFFRTVEDPRVARVVWLEVLGVSPRVDALYIRTTHAFAEMLLVIVRGLYPDWLRNAEQARLISLGIIGSISQVTMDWLLSGYRASRDDMVDAMATILQGMTLVADARR